MDAKKEEVTYCRFQGTNENCHTFINVTHSFNSGVSIAEAQMHPQQIVFTKRKWIREEKEKNHSRRSLLLLFRPERSTGSQIVRSQFYPGKRKFGKSENQNNQQQTNAHSHSERACCFLSYQEIKVSHSEFRLRSNAGKPSLLQDKFEQRMHKSVSNA